ncbi:cysteine hydrolase family protein [Aquibacillus kalidii]|uniref:cysteine hydrolase family protein n=1 Tax=Aquibacillus kalidii TaxID=2762597 RepID=UPI001644F0D1|nr:isochorismatase family cysteine hydrolase [Aquibacillus kalidii]
MKLNQSISNKSTAVLVVDIQNDYCHEDGYLARQGSSVHMIQQMIPKLDSFIEGARAEKLPIIFIKTIHEKSTDSPTWVSRMKGDQSGLCRKGEWGSEFYKIAPSSDDIVIVKHRYSAFIHTKLESVLKAYSIKELIIAGVSTNVCVESTARDGFMLDYGVTLLSDCTAAFSDEEHEMSLRNIDNYFGKVYRADQLFVQ